jgi:hypothetical protein
MSVTWNLVSDRARRIPERVFKIHEQCTPAMKFTCAAVTEFAAPGAESQPPLRQFIQHVGVVRNFVAEFIYRDKAGYEIF